MLHTTITTAYRGGTAPAGAAAGPSIEDRWRLAHERAVDEILEESFPASDPPPWTPGIVRPRAGNGVHHPGERPGKTADGPTRATAFERPAVPGGGQRSLLRPLVSLIGAVGVAWLAPVAILLVGLPVVLAVRGLLGVIAWVFGVTLQ